MTGFCNKTAGTTALSSVLLMKAVSNHVVQQLANQPTMLIPPPLKPEFLNPDPVMVSVMSGLPADAPVGDIELIRGLASLTTNPTEFDSKRDAGNFSPHPTCMWSSHFLLSWPLWPYRTKRYSTACCSVPARKLFWKWRAIPDTWAQKLVSSASCTPGVRSSPCIPMCIV